MRHTENKNRMADIKFSCSLLVIGGMGMELGILMVPDLPGGSTEVTPVKEQIQVGKCVWMGLCSNTGYIQAN